MAGSGDMLAACLGLGSRPSRLQAIDIDHRAVELGNERLSHVSEFEGLNGSAFDPEVWEAIPTQWDLVITNPPYVRYQLTSSASELDLDIPSAQTIREGLVRIIASLQGLTEDERNVFAAAARNYSGLADLAVPSWILCAALVSPGGRLAMVVPDTWLSRDYAFPVLYILNRFFDLEYIVRDVDAAWFEDALVRTTLVVARRATDSGTAFRPRAHLDIRITALAGNEQSLVGEAFKVASPEVAFADWAAGLRREQGSGTRPGIEATWSDGSDQLTILLSGVARNQWIEALGEDPSTASVAPPASLRRFVGKKAPALTTLESLGWSVGQGLRTGANEFFYVEVDDEGLATSKLLPDARLALPDEALVRAIASQSELPEGSLNITTTRRRLLMLRDMILPSDQPVARASNKWSEMEGDLASLVAAAAETTYRRQDESVPLPELSAVRTNVVLDDEGKVARFWYHLPDLQPRHQPQLAIPRVNNGRPACYAVDRGVVVDANFSTLWPSNEGISRETLVALLNSSWAAASMELTGTTMGGGALKLEATHLRRILIPRPDKQTARDLHTLGTKLIRGGVDRPTVDQVDRLVLQLVGSADPSSDGAEVRELSERLTASRNPRPAPGAPKPAR